MLYRLLLEVAKSKNAAGQNGPELGFYKIPFLEIPFTDFIIQGSLGILEEGINFIKC